MNNHFMEKTGKNDKLFVAYQDTFLNSQCLFVEYHDVIKSPWYIYLISAKDTDGFKKIFDTFDIDGLSYEGVYEWYKSRPTRNPLLSFPIQKEIVEKLGDDLPYWMDEFLEKGSTNPDIVNIEAMNGFVRVITNLLSINMTRNIVVYTEEFSESIKNDIDNIFSKKVHYVYGDLVAVLKDIPKDSTYVFSDITKILSLEENGRLDYSSVLIATRYGYNYTKNNELIIDIEKLKKDHIFKLNYFNI